MARFGMNVKNGFFCFILVFTIHCIMATCVAQMQGERRNPPGQGKRDAYSNRFTCLAFPMPMVNSDSVLLRLYIKIPYPSIQFVHRDSLFSAGIDLLVHIQNVKEEPLFGKIVKRNISVDTFRKTLDPRFTVDEMIEMKLVPGTYKAYIELDDAETTQPMIKTETITIPEYFSKPIVLTEPLFFRGSPRNASSVWSFPDIPPFRIAGDTLYYATVWIASKSIGTPDSERTVRLVWSISKELETGSKTTPWYRDSMVVVLKEHVQPVVLGLNQTCDLGRYVLHITVTDNKEKASVQGTFAVRWEQHPTNLPDFGMLVNTLMHIMNPKELEELKSLAPEEQGAALEQFWKKRDPTPGTPENELEEEYYRRIEYVNSHFSTQLDGSNGWKTDRGRTYLIYGTPTEVLRNPAFGSHTDNNRMKEVEIWYYQNIQKRFVFEDYTGTGDYRLKAQE